MSARLLHTCEDGHSWTEQPDGGVSPSWGLGGTSIRFDQPANRCPEPERFVVSGYAYGVECPGCGHRGLPWDMFVGLSGLRSVVLEEAERTGHTHLPPAPACGKPPVETRIWGLEGKCHNWLPVDPGAYLEHAPAGEQGVLC